MSEYDSDEDQSKGFFGGFMFGNIDKDGNLESNMFDEVTKNQLAQLNNICDVGIVSELTEEEKKTGDAENLASTERAEDAVDYSDINELALDLESEPPFQEKIDVNSSLKPSSSKSSFTPSFLKKSPSKHQTGGSDIILPSIVSFTSNQDSKRGSDERSSDHKRSKHSDKSLKKKSISKIEKRKRKKMRLRHQQLKLLEDKKFEESVKAMEASINQQEISAIFPQFRENKTLRFLRLFHNKGPSSFSNMWKNCRNRRKKKLKIFADSSVAASAADSGEASSSTCKPRSDVLLPWRAPSPPLPKPEDCLTDDEMTLLKPLKPKQRSQKQLMSGENTSSDPKKKPFPWKDSPASLWYRLKGLADDEPFEYGFGLRKDSYDDQGKVRTSAPQVTNADEFPSIDHFYMVSQAHWEDDIIWDAEEQKKKTDKKLQHQAADAEESYKLRVDRAAQAGWIPSSTQRALLSNPSKTSTLPMAMDSVKKPSGDEKVPTSIFPIDNYNLIYGDWEKHIIWDAQNMDSIPEPTVFKYDPNDENILLELPDEPKPTGNKQLHQGQHQSKPDGKKDTAGKKGKGSGGKNANKENNEIDEPRVLIKKDRWNLSNDEFYESKKSNSACLSLSMSSVLQHSTPAMQLHSMFFHTSMKVEKRQLFHRPHLRRYQNGPMSNVGLHKVHCTTKFARKKAKSREQERAQSGGGEVFFMREPKDLSALDGILIMAEYSEEYPPLISQVGMAIKIKNFYKRKPDKDSEPPKYRYGDLVYSHSTSPFLGSLSPGESLQAFECNMFRAPAYEHRTPDTDFLLIRTRYGYFIRVVPSIFAVGQECPLIEVPGPNSKKATNHVRDFLQVFIYRMFASSTDQPKKIRMEEIKKAFPHHSETSIRKRLKLCAEFNRTGQDSNWWVIRKDFRLPSEEEMRAMVSPEQTCSFYSMIAAEQRLKDAGYGDKNMMIQPEEDNEEEHQMKVDEEVLNAPWNTTRAFLAAVKGKCLLQVTGPADPTGCGEGFSYAKVPMKPQQVKAESQPAPPKKQVTGTDADLRRLSLSAAKQLLKKFGVKDEEIKKLSRWEVIDVVRTMSTEQARSGDSGVSKYARGTRFSIAEHQEKYKEECQRLFDLQNKVLSSRQILSTDEDSSSGEDSDYEEMGKNIENLLSNKKSSDQLVIEKEEEERKELLKMAYNNDSNSSQNKKEESETRATPIIQAGGCLNITRTFKNEDGSEYTRVETVRRPEVIEAYCKIRSHKNESFIKRYIMMDEQNREEMRREKRRLQEQLRRIKRNQQKAKQLSSDKEKKKDRKKEKESKFNPNIAGMKCGACGQSGHMRTNRHCPFYKSSTVNDPNAVITEEEEEEMEQKNLKQNHLVKIDGLKFTIPKEIVKQSEPENLKMVLKVPPQHKHTPPKPPSDDNFAEPASPKPTAGSGKEGRKRKKTQSLDYLERRAKKKDRKRNPLVSLSSHLEATLNKLRDLPDTDAFHCPVNPRHVKDYYTIIDKPMDLQTMRQNLHKNLYFSRADFIEHIDLIISNSCTYNGPESPFTKTALKMREFTCDQFSLKEDKLMRLENQINPLVDDDDQVAFTQHLENILHERVLSIEESLHFKNPVNRNTLPEYYRVVKEPMDLNTIKRNVKKHMYRDRAQFMKHIELLLLNSLTYNGSESVLSRNARKIVDVCRAAFYERDAVITSLENGIAAAEKAAQAEADGMSHDGGVVMMMGMNDEDSNMSARHKHDDEDDEDDDDDDEEDEADDDIDEEMDYEEEEEGEMANNDGNSAAVVNAPDANMDACLLKAFEDAGADAQQSNGAEQRGNEGLLDDLYLSDGEEMSASEEDEEESEVEGDNPFAASESEDDFEAAQNAQNNRLGIDEESNNPFNVERKYHRTNNNSKSFKNQLTSSDDDDDDDDMDD